MENITIRPARTEDCKPLWELRNEESAREASLDSHPIPYEEHKKWFAGKLKDKSTLIFMTLNGDSQPMGYARLNLSGEDAEISVCVAPEFRRRRLGTSLIRKAAEEIIKGGKVQRVLAQVKTNNEVSLKAFERGGFKRLGTKKIRGTEVFEMAYSPSENHPVLFRVDSGDGIGLGHLKRCLSLAMALRSLKQPSVFLTRPNAQTDPIFKHFDCARRHLDAADSWGNADIDETIKMARHLKSLAIVVDSDIKQNSYLERLRQNNFILCSVEDNGPPPEYCHLVVNGNAHANQLRPGPVEGEFLLGSDYSILSPEYWTTPDKNGTDEVKNILITLGGADPYGLTPGIIETLDKLPKKFSMTVVIGPFFKNAEEIESQAARATKPVTLVHSPKSLSSAIEETQLAVSAAGQTLYELARTGCPTVAIVVASNQDGQLAEFVVKGVVKPVGHAKDPQISKQIAKEVTGLILNPDKRLEMRKAGQRLVDGQGALRVAKKILALVPPLS